MTNREVFLRRIKYSEYTDGEIVYIIESMLRSAKVLLYFCLEDIDRLNRWMKLECDLETLNFTDLEVD